LSLLNEAREKTEGIIDRLHNANGKEGKKPRTYRKRARKEFVGVAKQRNKSRKAIRRGIRKQLGYVNRNLKTIKKQAENLGNKIKSKVEEQNQVENQELMNEKPENIGYKALSKREQRNLEVCGEVFKQQEQMYKEKKQRVEDRIVSISQPHVRPIKRGKAGAETEFGSKILISVVDGYSRIEKLAWDNYNEGNEFIASVEAYKKRYGYYPESTHVDKIFLTKENRKHCKELGIRISGPPLGRPSNDEVKNREALKLEAQDGRDRIPVEGKFGNGKRKYGLNRIFAKKMNTSECEIAVGILLLNLDKLLRGIISVFDHKNRNIVNGNSSSNVINSKKEAA